MDRGSGFFSGTGCWIGLLIVLLGAGYLIYMHHPLQVVYQANEAEDTLRQVQAERSRARHLGPPLLQPALQ